MDNFLKMLDTQMVLMVYMAVGFICAKKDIIDQHAKQKITDLILNVALPCMIFASFNEPLTAEVIHDAEMVLIVAACITFLSYFGGQVLYSRFPDAKKRILRYSTLVNNSGFIGMAMVDSIYGAEGLFYASIFIIPNRIAMWTAGISIFTTASLKEGLKKVLLNPCIIAVALGLVREFTGFPLPDFIDSAIAGIGDITSPLSMFIIGTMLVGISLGSMIEPSILYLSFIRLIALPIIALVVLNLIGLPPMLAGISMILTGMPAGSTTVLLAVKYGADPDFASRCVVTTTIISLVTVPLLMFLI